LKNFINDIKNRILIFDGSKGYMLQKLGLKGGECPELWNITHREQVKKVHALYKEAGSDVIQTNTFQGNRVQLEKYSLGDKTYELNYEGARLAREVMGREGYVAASIGPVGKLFEPSGDLTFEHAYEIFKEQIEAVVDGGVDIINFETFTDLAEMRAALLAAKDVTELPVICSVAFESNGRTLMGSDPYTVATVLKSLGADIIGTNCSFGPKQSIEIIKAMSEAGGIYLCAKPNAGLPDVVNGQVIYKESAKVFSELAPEFAGYGVKLIGGCCGTTPEFVAAIKESLKDVNASKLNGKSEKVISSGVSTLKLENNANISLGYLNTAADEELNNELKNGNIEIITDRALDLAAEGFDAVYINVDSLQGNDMLLSDVVNIAQGYIKDPFILETENDKALEKTLRIYRGKAGIVVDGYSPEIMGKLIKVASKYGSTVIKKSVINA
jgi:5-methyltetrahydrofolate--homocysteine methyltransferase